LSDPTVDSQMVTLKASGADLFYNITTPKFGAQAIKKAAELGWKPVQILDINATRSAKRWSRPALKTPKASSRSITARTPQRRVAAGLVMPAATAETMSLHLTAIGRKVGQVATLLSSSMAPAITLLPRSRSPKTSPLCVCRPTLLN
jgi:hypothetical protein